MPDAPVPETPTPAPFAWTEFLGKLGAVSGLIAAWLFLVGWSWAYYWFAGFGVGISSITFDNRALPLWGLLAAKAYWWQIGLVAAAAGIAGTRLARSRLPADLIVGLLAIGLAAAFAGGFKLGDLKAARDRAWFASSGWTAFTPLRIDPKPDAAPADSALAKLAADSQSGCWRLLYDDGKSIFVFRPLANRPDIGLPVVRIDAAAVALVRVGPIGFPACRD